MSFGAAVKSVFNQYVGFTGRARRSEYWWFALFTVLVSIVASVLDNALRLTFVDGSSNGFIGLIASLALLLPTLAVAVRRLHDTDKTGWWLLIPAPSTDRSAPAGIGGRPPFWQRCQNGGRRSSSIRVRRDFSSSRGSLSCQAAATVSVWCSAAKPSR
ncbi:DUF805 domain-containing protein [Micromonospora sp. NPDC049102]|uniref:DUF805 domain-containing protein n=1 Tax=Micromonospora sp. NPDC049102 TaxID=3364265 RepID=UPI00371791EC